MKKNVNVFEAAVLVGMSPELLKWFTSYAPKSGDPRKLATVGKVNSVTLFDEDELLDFSRWLAQPWPTNGATRPPIPTGIEREIKNESVGQCALCKTHGDSCEAAHIEPVSQSKNNHPHNLIWLCANHHTKFDKGHLGPKKKDAQFVRDYKQVLLWHSKQTHLVKSEASKIALHLLETARRAAALNPKTPEQHKAAAAVGEDVISKLVAVSKRKVKKPAQFAAFKKLGELAVNASDSKADISERLSTITKGRRDFVLAAGLETCPLCEGNGRWHGDDCPYCGGDGAVSDKVFRQFDSRDYEQIDCPVCDGDGRRNGEDCPACHGDCQMERRYAERIEVRDFELVECSLCDGAGTNDGEDCPICGGNGKLEKRFTDKVYLSDFDMVNCPLCDGEGQYNDNDCPACGGERTMPRRSAESIDVSRFKPIECPLCEGTGEHNEETCPYCGGEREVCSEYADQFDNRMYELVKCPVCKGRGYNGDADCGPCEGRGEVLGELAERFRDGY